MTNKELKEMIKGSGFFQWQLALKAGITEMTLIRWLREPERKERIERISKAIEELKKEAREAAEND